MTEQLSPISVALAASLHRRHAALAWLITITREPTALAGLRADLADVERYLAEIDELLDAVSTPEPDAPDQR